MNLVILAAGLGNRYGGLKQIEPIDEEGNFIIDYSIYDAIRCGFDKVVFVIKKENFEIFKSTIGKRAEKHIKTEYAFQEIPTHLTNRTKPLGTAHAVLSAKNEIVSNFAVINADDYYGYDAIKQIANFLKFNKNENQYALVAFNAINTIETEPVKRGVCFSKNNNLVKITESLIEKENNVLFATELGSTKTKQQIKHNQIVSMNLFGFTKTFLTHLESEFDKFLSSTINLETQEFFLPTVVSNLIKQNKAKVQVLKTSSKWQGMTYKEDKIKVENFIKNLKNQNIYPQNLWI